MIQFSNQKIFSETVLNDQLVPTFAKIYGNDNYEFFYG